MNKQCRLVASLVLSLAGAASAQGGPPQAQGAPPSGTPTVSISSPADATLTNKTAIEVTVVYAAGAGRGNPHVTQIDLLLEGQRVSSARITGREGTGGTHTFAAVDISSIANTGQPGTFVARAFQGNARRENSRDSAPVRIRVDTIAPVISSPQPPGGSSVTNLTPTLSAAWNDPPPGSGIDTGSALIQLDNVPVAASVNVTGFSFTPAPLAPGTHTVSAQIRDLAGNPASLRWSFQVAGAPSDTIPPAISNLAPADGSFTNNPRPPLSASISDAGGAGINPGSIVLSLNGIVVPATVTLQDLNNALVTFTPNFDIAQGQNAFSVDASDLAGNPSSTASSAFTLDQVPPVITLASPTQGQVVGSLLVPLDANASDAAAGVSTSGVQITLNAVDITSGVTRTQLTPASVGITGDLVALPGTNVLDISAADRAGNVAFATRTFSSTADLQGVQTLSLEIVSGNGQIGLTNRCLKEDLVVRVFDALSGLPVSGVPVSFKGLGLYDGGPVATPAGSCVSDDAGLARTGWLLTRVPGSSTVKASLEFAQAGSNIPEALRYILSAQFEATFTLQAKSPTMTDVSTPGPNNFCGFKTEEFPGSALSKLMKYQLKDHDGNPLSDVVVSARVIDFEGASPPNKLVGEFLPGASMTDANGTAPFAFVIDKDLLPRTSDGTTGDFTMEFFLPDFRDVNGKPISKTMPGRVLHPDTRPFPPTEIDYTDPTLSGQSQVGLPNLPLAIPLRTKGHNAVKFYIIEGQGTIAPGPEAGLRTDDTDHCGSYTQINTVVGGDNIQRASIIFKMAPGFSHALIAIDGVTDVFAVGPPTADLALASDPTGPLAQIALLGDLLDTAGTKVTLAQAQFVARAVLPSNYDSSAVADVTSHDQCGNPLQMSGAIAALKVEGLPMSRIMADHKSSVWTTRVSAPLAGIEGVAAAGTPSLPAGTTFLQGDTRGMFGAVVHLGGVQVKGLPKPNLQLLGDVVYVAGENGFFNAPLVLSQEANPRLGVPLGATWKGYRWVITRPGTTGEAPFYTLDATLHVTLSNTVNDLAPAVGKGQNWVTPVTLQIPRNDALRRGLGTISVEPRGFPPPPPGGGGPPPAEILWYGGKKIEGYWLGSPGFKTGAAVTLVPDPANPGKMMIDQTVIDNLPSIGEANGVIAAHAFNTVDTVSGDANIRTERKALINVKSGLDNPFAAKRITSVSQSHSREAKLEVLAEYYGYFSGPITQPFETRNLGILFYTPAVDKHLDLPDLNATLRHEVRHMKHFVAAAGGTFPGIGAGDTTPALLMKDVYSFVKDKSAGLDAATIRKHHDAAMILVKALTELDAEFSTIVEILPDAADNVKDTTTSYATLEEATKALRKHYTTIMKTLQGGVNVAGVGKVNITDVGGNVRTRLIDYLKSVYNGLPEWAHLLRQRVQQFKEVDLSDPNAYVSTTRIQIPK